MKTRGAKFIIEIPPLSDGISDGIRRIPTGIPSDTDGCPNSDGHPSDFPSDNGNSDGCPSEFPSENPTGVFTRRIFRRQFWLLWPPSGPTLFPSLFPSGHCSVGIFVGDRLRFCSATKTDPNTDGYYDGDSIRRISPKNPTRTAWESNEVSEIPTEFPTKWSSVGNSDRKSNGTRRNIALPTENPSEIGG